MPLVDESNEAYHASAGFSKSKLWKYHTMTPYRAEFGKVEEKDYFLFGQAGHIAVLEPERLDSAVFKATANRRGTNEWKANEEEASGRIVLKADEYDQIMIMRDLAYAHEDLRHYLNGKPIIEKSCYTHDEEHGVMVKCRPDLYSPELAGMVDVKFLSSIDDDSWSRDLGVYGYVMQDAMYVDIWNKGSGMEADHMVFACISKTEPPEIIVRQIEDIDVEEGHKAYRAALAVAAECHRKQEWPGQPKGVVRGVKMRDRDRRYTEPQWRKEEESEDGE